MKIEIKLDPEQYDMIYTALVQIAQASVRMADSWEAPNKSLSNNEAKPTRQYTRHNAEVSIDALFRDLGLKQDSGVFKIACKMAGVNPFYHKSTKSKRLYIPAEYKEEVSARIRKLI